MNKTEITLLNSFQKLITDQVDPIKICQRLHVCRVLKAPEKASVFSVLREGRTVVWQKFILLIKEKCSFPQLLQVLLDCGYTELFLQIAIQWRCLQSNQTRRMHICRTDSIFSSRRFSEDLFIKLKIKTHNVEFRGNPRDSLRHKSNFYKTEYLNETDNFEKYVKADQYAATLCAEIDAHTMLYKRSFPTHGLFEELKKILPHTSNTQVTQIAYDSRLAIAYAIAEHDDEGEKYLRSAMSSSVTVGYCVELVNMLYIYVFNLLCIYEKNPTQRTLDKIMNIAEFSLHCLQEETDDVIRHFWMRMFYLRMIYCLLGISNKGDIIPGCFVQPRHIDKASNLLVEVDKIWDGIETRRQMFYFVAQARVAELENTQEDTNLAHEYLHLAIDIGLKSQFGETDFIRSYAQSISNKVMDFDVHNIEENDNFTIKGSDKAVDEHHEKLHKTCNDSEKIGVEHDERENKICDDTSITSVKRISTEEQEDNIQFTPGSASMSKDKHETTLQLERTEQVLNCSRKANVKQASTTENFPSIPQREIALYDIGNTNNNLCYEKTNTRFENVLPRHKTDFKENAQSNYFDLGNNHMLNIPERLFYQEQPEQLYPNCNVNLLATLESLFIADDAQKMCSMENSLSLISMKRPDSFFY